MNNFNRRSLVLGALFAVTFYLVLFILIFYTILKLEHEEVAVMTTFVLSLGVIPIYIYLEKVVNKHVSSSRFQFDMAFFLTSILLLVIYGKLINSSLTADYMNNGIISRGLGFWVVLFLMGSGLCFHGIVRLMHYGIIRSRNE